MSTTALFIELLVIGLEALAWIALLIGIFFGLDWITSLGVAFEKASGFTTVVVIGIAYLIGIIVDEICDALVSPWTNRIRSSVREKGHPEMWDMQSYVLTYSKEVTEQLGYVRSRIRITRSSIFNLGLIGILAIVFISKQVSIPVDAKSSLILFVAITSVVIVGMTIFVYWRTELSYWLRTRSVYKSLTELAPRSTRVQSKRNKKSK
ncbi:MAG: hypothetical protein EHM20_00435 [Alphaproteobacteria bacterium]|nr:MAG: hypothetical protein EHM20_00435 [Alphaproteobacteria bacterium]